MEEEILKELARQLRKPQDEMGKEVGAKMNESNRLINEFAIDALRLTANEHVLEIGMGNGYFAGTILSISPSLHYTGTDFSELMVNEARILNKSLVEEGRAAFHLTDGIRFPFEDDSFDKVMTVNTIYFWEDPLRMLAEIRRVMKKGSRLVIGMRPKETMSQYPFVKYGFNMYEETELRSLLAQSEFSVENVSHKEEPDQELGDHTIKVNSSFFCAIK